MAALVKKAPALLAAAKELATPKLNTFLRYAKVGIAEPNQYFLINTSLKVELVPPTPGEIPAAIADISTKVRCSHVKSIWNTHLTSFCLSRWRTFSARASGNGQCVR